MWNTLEIGLKMKPCNMRLGADQQTFACCASDGVDRAKSGNLRRFDAFQPANRLSSIDFAFHLSFISL